MSHPHSNGPNGKAVNALPGNVTALLSTQQLDSIHSIEWAQSEDTSRLAWLSQQFEKVGLHLYRMGDSTLMVTSIGAGMARQLPDMRTAKAYLAMMGGAL